MKKYVLLILIMITGTQLFAQSSSAYIVFVEGDGFSLIRNGEETIYDLSFIELENEAYDLVLKEGDTISTADNTFLEIEMVPSNNVIKISENTYFTIKDIKRSGAGTFEVTYGSIRAKVAQLLDKDKFRVLSQSVVAGVRGTDFGYDMTFSAEPGAGSGALANVYCFEGSVEVSEVTYVDGKEVKSNEVLLEENDQLSVDIFEPRKAMKEDNVKEIDDNILAFWKENDFSGNKHQDRQQTAELASSELDNSTEEIIETETIDVTDTEEDIEAETAPEETAAAEEAPDLNMGNYNRKKGRNVIIGIGFGLEVAGAALYALSPEFMGDKQQSFRDITAYSMGGVGVLTLIGAIIAEVKK